MTNAGQANAATGTQGYEDSVTCAAALAKALGVTADEVLLQSTGQKGRLPQGAKRLCVHELCEGGGAPEWQP